MKTKTTFLKATVLILVIVLMIINAGNAQGPTDEILPLNRLEQPILISKADQPNKSSYSEESAVYFEKEEGVVRLNWKTPPFSNAISFVIQRSVDRKKYEVVTTVIATGSTNKSNFYSLDITDVASFNTQFRILQVNAKGLLSSFNTVVFNNETYSIQEDLVKY